MKCKRETDGRQLDHQSLQTIRNLAVKAVKAGQTVESVAAANGVNIRTVFKWLAAYASGGQTALMAKPIPGRPMKLTPDEMRWVAQAVRDDTPLQWKFDFALWTLSIIRELIRRQFGKTLSNATVSHVMRILGFTVQRPLYRAWQQDATLVERWRAEDYPAIQAEAKAVGATIYFADESGIRSDYHTGGTWAPEGQTPIVTATGRRYSLAMISAVSARGDFRFMVHTGTVTASVFRDFLKRLLIGASQPVYVVVDGHPIHKAKLVRDFVVKQSGRLKLFYLPPYAPQLNPDEQVWGNVKARVSKRLPKSIHELKRMVLGALRHLQKLPHVVQGFFRHPDCRYAV
jgi:transposase